MARSSVDTVTLLRPAVPARRGRRELDVTPLLQDFFAGPENRFPVFICRQQELIAERGNPLLLIGPSGSGKTVLALTLAAHELNLPRAASTEAAGEAAASGHSTRPTRSSGEPATASTNGLENGERVLYFPAVDFARGYAEAVQADDIDHFRQRIMGTDCLLIDDVHTIADKLAAQEELAARIEQRVQEQRATILTCRRLPTELRGIRPFLASRMLPGLTVPIELPGPEARRAIIRRLADNAEFEIADETIDLLCRGLPEEIPARRLNAALNHLRLWKKNGGNPDDPRAVQAAVDAIGATGEPTVAQIAKAVARRFKLKTSDLKSSTRRQQVVRARSLAMFLARQLTDASLQSIGSYFGGRDHTTVMHACRKTEKLLSSNSDLSQTADEVTQQLNKSA